MPTATSLTTAIREPRGTRSRIGCWTTYVPTFLGLITFRKKPPLARNRYDWRQIAHDCGIDEALTMTLKTQLRPALDAIMRWLKEPPVEDDALNGARLRASTLNAGGRRKSVPTAATQGHARGRVARSPSASRRGPRPNPISDKPEPLFEANENLSSFADALAYHMRRFGESYWQLHRAVVRIDETSMQRPCYPGSRAIVCLDPPQA